MALAFERPVPEGYAPFEEIFDQNPSNRDRPKDRNARATVRTSSPAYQWRSPETLPPRQWLYGRTYLRGIVTATIAPGGVGKSTLKIGEAVAMAAGEPLLGQRISAGKPLRVWYWNGEDGRDEIEKKVAALLLHHNLTQDDIEDRLHFDSGHDCPLRLVVPGEKSGHVIDPDVANFIDQKFANDRIDVALFDPFVSLHSVDENSNAAIDVLVKELARIAIKRGVAIGVAHHARKGGVNGTGETKVEDSRGAISLISAARVARVLNVMQEAEAEQVGVEVGQRFRYFRADDGKVNLAPRAEKANWFRLESVSLGNAADPYPADEIGVAIPWEMPGLMDQVSVGTLLRVQRRLDEGAWKVSTQSPEWAGYVVAEIMGLDATDPADRTKIKKLLATWMKSGALKQEQKRGEDRHMRPCYVPGEWANA